MIGRLFHSRTRPKSHRFSYPAFYALTDLANPPEGKLAPANKQHLSTTDDSILEKINRMAGTYGTDVSGRILMLSQPQVFGLGFNPLSVYFCHAKNGEPSALVLEVRNTPWLEREVYWLPPLAQQKFTKTFHVSPFNPAGQHYELNVDWPTQGKTSVKLTLLDEDGALFTACMHLKEANFSVGHWTMPALTLFGIYWQALKLWLKGVRYEPYPEELKQQ